MPNLRTMNNRRKSREHKGEFADWHYGDIYQACNYHPLRMTDIDYRSNSIDGVSLLDGKEYSCSLYNCGVYKMTEQEITEHLAAWAEDQERGLMRLNGWSPEAAEEFIRVWR